MEVILDADEFKALIASVPGVESVSMKRSPESYGQMRKEFYVKIGDYGMFFSPFFPMAEATVQEYLAEVAVWLDEKNAELAPTLDDV